MNRFSDLREICLGDSGQQIATDYRRILEANTEADLSSVRIYTDAAARQVVDQLSVTALSIGRHILFGSAAPDIYSPEGLWLLAHEVAHVLQRPHLEFPDALMLQGAPGAPGQLSHPSVLEQQASAFANDVMRDHRRRRRAWLVAPPDQILCHGGPPCPGPPDWLPISARPIENWLAANLAIEYAYKFAHGGQAVLLGSDFAREGRNTVTLPKGVNLSPDDRKFAELILTELKGTVRQLQPDIINFTHRAIYEIKSAEDAEKNPSKVDEQLESYYRLIDAIAKSANHASWLRDTPDWHPPHSLPFPGNPNRLVCTQRTNYIVGARKSLNRPGLILYTILERAGADEEERKKRAQRMRLVDLAPEVRDMADRILSEFRRSVPEPTEDEYLIICEQSFLDSVIIPRGRLSMEQTLRLLNVPAMDIRQNPIILVRLAGWTIVGVAELIHVIIGVTLLTGAFGASAAASGTIATAPPIVLQNVALLGKAANDTTQIIAAAAAGVLFMVGTTTIAKAQAGQSGFQTTGAVIAAPLSSVQSTGTLSTGVKVTFQGKEFFYVGRASAK